MTTAAAAAALASVLVLLLVVAPAAGSAGDRDPAYILCSKQCVEDTCQDDEADDALPWDLRLLNWSCAENCRYSCMFQVTEERVSRGEQVLQYHGKWPFIRVLGVQEPSSVLASIAYLQSVPADYEGRPLVKAYALVSINAWVWSTVFHARDFPMTEKLDYFSAMGTIVFGIYVASIRVFNLKQLGQRVRIAAPLFGYYAYHVRQMLVKFDYGWNMQVSMAFAVIHSLMWVAWHLYHRRPYGYKAMISTLVLWLVISLELLDFAPILYVFDAHSIWHWSTVPLMWLWYDFLRDDANWEHARQANKAHLD